MGLKQTAAKVSFSWTALFITVLFLAFNTSSSSAQHTAGTGTHEAEGYFFIGSTGCTIIWDNTDQVYKVTWDDGAGSTTLQYIEQLADGNYMYDEYEKGGKIRRGTFIFRAQHENGFYTGMDGKRHTVKR